MDAREILTRVKDGTLDRATAGALLGGQDAGPRPSLPAAAETPEPIAVVGYSARFPGADHADAFWRRLLDGEDLVTEVPQERWRIGEHYDPDPAAEGKSVSRWGAFVDDADRFDADFFQMTPREAELTDPQARLFLQESWRALEHAGLGPDALGGTRCGVYAGVMLNDYQNLIERQSAHARLPQVMQGNSHSILAARIAYYLDLKGPAVTVDTACSSSLTALHLACQTLWLGEAEVMLAGGVTLYLTELPHVFMSRAGMLSPTGRCRPFDAAADGIVPGEGCAVAVLKPLSRALADRDPVHGVIRASGLGQDGRTNGITAPSAAAQATLISRTLRRFAVNPAEVDYLECHGTGTPLGDPIEVTALNEAFSGADLPPASVPIGSVKGNLGHTSAAAGMAGLLKALGVVRTGQVPPTLHHAEANPEIPFSEGPFTVATRLRELAPTAGRPRRASVSSFGFSGTNAYVVVEEPPASRPESPAPAAGRDSDLSVLVPLSGRRPDAAAAYAADLARWMRGPGTAAPVTDIAHTLARTRAHHPHRAALVVAGREELLASLDLLAGGAPDGRRVESAGAHRPEPTVWRAQAELGDRLLRGFDGHVDAGRLRALAKLYVAGHRIDWAVVSPDDEHTRLSLPGYPFARDRHYAAPPDSPAPAEGEVPADPGALPEAGPGELVLHEPVWVDAPLPAEVSVPAGPLLVHDPVGGVATALEKAGVRVHRAAAGADAHAAAQALLDAGATEAVVLLRLGATHPSDRAGVAADRAVFDVAQTVLRVFRTQRLTVLVVTADPARADAAAALVQTLRQENPRLSGRAVLVDADEVPEATLLLAELASPQAEHGHLCDVRGGDRRRRVLVPIELPAAAPAPARERVCLISGGMGGVGLALARHLAARPEARVVLCGRTPWEKLDAAAREVVAATARMRYAQTDVTDPDAAAELVRGILDREGALHAVFHAAGVLRDSYLVRKGPEDVTAVLAPKAAGALALDEATADLPLEAFVLFSSVVATSGNLGQSDYAYANGLLDGFAARRAEQVQRGERSGRTLSVRWPSWDVPGMTIPEPIRAVVQEHTGMTPLPAAVAAAALDRLLGADGPPVVSLFHGDAAKWRHHLAGLQLTAGRPEPLWPERVVAGPNDGQRGRLRDLVCRTVADTLGRPATSVGPRTSLESLGLDSVMMRTLASRLSTEVAPVAPEALFGLRDLDTLVDHLAVDLLRRESRLESNSRLESKAKPAYQTRSRAESGPVKTATTAVEPNDDRYAIVGLSGRYPQAPDLDAFWQNLLSGRETVSDLPTDRWEDARGVAARGHFLDRIDAFDPAFFGLSAYEGALLDPQERLFLEVAWEALEGAGYTGSRLDALVASDGERRSVGVFVGITSSDYQMLGAEHWARGHLDMPSGHYWSLPNRLSYLLDLRGPSQPVDTACSSSLVALHLALDAMRRGECAAALVGGVNLYLHPSRFRMLRQSGFLAEDGRCRSFGAGGTGFGPGEGAGAVLVKPLSSALADRDTVHAVVRGSAVAHGGRTNGFTAPSPWAQARVIRKALVSSGTHPATVSVIEAHGTGTELGDPVELSGLQDTYGRGPAARNPCALGSVKSGIGHGESAAGIAALTKVVLQLRHGTLAPTLHADPVNQRLRLEDTRFTLQHTAGPWRPFLDSDGRALPRRAGISSFGAGGVNAHVIVEEFQPGQDGQEPKAAPRRERELVVLSAPSPEHLMATAGRLTAWLDTADAPADLSALAHTLRAGRAALDCRLAVVARDPAELAGALAAYARGEAGGGARFRDLRAGGAADFSLGEAPETASFLAELWRNGRLDQVAALWLSGLEVDWTALEGAVALVPLPSSVFLRRRLWLTEHPEPGAGAVDRPAVVADAAEMPVPTGPEPAELSPAGPPVAHADAILAELAKLAGELVPGLGGPAGTDRPLLELGIDSIGLMNLRFEITERFGQTLALHQLSESTITALAARLSADHARAGA